MTRWDTSRVFYTALVLQTLNAYDATFALGGAQAQVVTYLRTQQHADGGYGEPESTPFETALVLQALLEAGGLADLITQANNGSSEMGS